MCDNDVVITVVSEKHSATLSRENIKALTTRSSIYKDFEGIMSMQSQQSGVERGYTTLRRPVRNCERDDPFQSRMLNCMYPCFLVLC